MSIVTVQLGQCGNQIGSQFFASLVNDLSVKPDNCTRDQHRDYVEAATERFFCSSETGKEGQTTLQARAVSVDMEAKVISQTLMEAKRSGRWRYPSYQQFSQKKGSGNNWAHGYCVHGPKARDAILDMIRKETEKCDRLDGFLTLLSLAGGTGSGVGAYVTQCLRDNYPHSFILNQVVWPYSTGEVIVQNYNAVLTLSHLYQCSDAILAMENDVIQKICSQLMRIPKVSFKDLNGVIAHKLASVMLPVYSSSNDTTWTNPIRNHMGSMLEHLVSHPEYKLLTLRNIPQMSEGSLKYSCYQWHGLLKHLRQMLVADAAMEEGIDWQVKATRQGGDFNRSIANLLILRGLDLQQADVEGFRDCNLYVPWLPTQYAFANWVHPRPLHQYEKSAALLSNSQTPVRTLNGVTGKAWSMFASRAYVHQYLKHGMTEEDFVDSFACLEQVISNYKNI